MAIRALHKAPAYFWYVPATASGKYHADADTGMGGAVRHTKGVFRVASELFQNPLLTNMIFEEDKDVIRAAILVHDTCIRGISDEPEPKQRHDHPILVRDRLRPDDGPWSMEEENMWDAICDLAESHMGPWNTREDSEVILPIPVTYSQQFVHLCDYIGSRRGININVFDRIPAVDYHEKPALASEGQLRYLSILNDKCHDQGVKNPYSDVEIYKEEKEGEYTLVLSMKKASEIITELKAMLGIGSKDRSK